MSTQPLLHHVYSINDGTSRCTVTGFATFDDKEVVIVEVEGRATQTVVSLPKFQEKAVHLSAPTRKAWVDYFMAIVKETSTRSTCDRKHVGAVLVLDHRILTTGYNGSPPGAPHCDDVGHDMGILDGRETCLRTIHAEVNAIVQAGVYGVRTHGTTCYVNTFPCWNCAKTLLAARVKKVVYDADYYNDPRVNAAFSAAGVELISYKRRA